jgi:hypothetical protein
VVISLRPTLRKRLDETRMHLTDSIWIRTTPERVFGFFENMDAGYRGLHANHQLFRWEEGRGMREGVVFHVEENISFNVVTERVRVSRVEPDRRIELAFIRRALRLAVPRMVLRMEPEAEGTRLTWEIRIRTWLGRTRLDRDALDAVRRRVRQEAESLKGLLEGDPFVSAVEPFLRRLRAAVEENPDFSLVAFGALHRGADGSLSYGVECERADGTLPGLKLSFRCWHQPPHTTFKGTLGALVDWHRPPPRERTVYEAQASRIRFEGPPPIDEFLPQLHRLEQVMRTALARRGPAGRTFKVYLVESEADRGRRIDEEVEFMTREEAVRYAEEYNRSYNSGPIRSEWSMIAIVERDDGYSVLG